MGCPNRLINILKNTVSRLDRRRRLGLKLRQTGDNLLYNGINLFDIEIHQNGPP
jgi:hypothetical protein